MTKAQGLPITTVILAALGLVVLIILFAILTGKLQIFGKGLSTCPGQCMDNIVECEKVGYVLGDDFRAPEFQIKNNEYGEGEPCGGTKNRPRASSFCCSSRKK